MRVFVADAGVKIDAFVEGGAKRARNLFRNDGLDIFAAGRELDPQILLHLVVDETADDGGGHGPLTFGSRLRSEGSTRVRRSNGRTAAAQGGHHSAKREDRTGDRHRRPAIILEPGGEAHRDDRHDDAGISCLGRTDLPHHGIVQTESQHRREKSEV